MGFEKAQIEKCMRLAFNNPNRAAEYLMSGIPEGLEEAINKTSNNNNNNKLNNNKQLNNKILNNKQQQILNNKQLNNKQLQILNNKLQQILNNKLLQIELLVFKIFYKYIHNLINYVLQYNKIQIYFNQF